MLQVLVVLTQQIPPTENNTCFSVIVKIVWTASCQNDKTQDMKLMM